MSANIVMFGVPRTGSSIAASLLEALGWNFFPDANGGGESPGMIAIQQQMVNWDDSCFEQDRFDVEAARTLLATASSPWLIKDLTLSYTMDLWLPLMRESSGGLPILGVMTTRDPVEVEMSWRKRTSIEGGGNYVRPDGQVATKNENVTLGDWRDQAERAYEAFPEPKVRFDFAQLKEAARRFDPRRIQSQAKSIVGQVVHPS